MDTREFISAILNDPSLKQTERARVIELLARDFQSGRERNKENRPAAPGPVAKRNEWVHDPRTVCRFLKKFSEDSVLKTTVHSWAPGDFDGYDDFIGKIKQCLRGIDTYNDLYRYNIGLNYTVKNFLECNKPKNPGEFRWGGEKIRIGLQYPEGAIREWMSRNPDQNGFWSMPLDEFPQENRPVGRFGGKILSNMEEVCELFKCCIEFRDVPGKRFEDVVRKAFRNSDFNATFEGLEGISFYTYTPAVRNALDTIAHNIKDKVSKSAKVRIFVEQFDDSFDLHILHVGSFSEKKTDNEKLRNGTMAALRKHKDVSDSASLMSVCDFAVESRFLDSDGTPKSYRIDYLYPGLEGDGVPAVKINKLDHDVEGFDYILRF